MIVWENYQAGRRSHAFTREGGPVSLCGISVHRKPLAWQPHMEGDTRCKRCAEKLADAAAKAKQNDVDDVSKFDTYMAHYQAVLEKKLATIPNEDVTELPRFQIALARVISKCNVRHYVAAEEAMKELRNIVLHRSEIRDMAERHMKEKKE